EGVDALEGEGPFRDEAADVVERKGRGIGLALLDLEAQPRRDRAVDSEWGGLLADGDELAPAVHTPRHADRGPGRVVRAEATRVEVDERSGRAPAHRHDGVSRVERASAVGKARGGGALRVATLRVHARLPRLTLVVLVHEPDEHLDEGEARCDRDRLLDVGRLLG